MTLAIIILPSGGIFRVAVEQARATVAISIEKHCLVSTGLVFILSNLVRIRQYGRRQGSKDETYVDVEDILGKNSGARKDEIYPNLDYTQETALGNAELARYGDTLYFTEISQC